MKTMSLAAILLAVLFASASFATNANTRVSQPAPNWWKQPPSQTPAAVGSVIYKATDQIRISTKAGDKSFAITPETKIWVKGQKGTIDDIQLGDIARIVFGKQVNGLPQARRIEIPKPHIGGEIAAIQGNVLTIKKKDQVWTVVVPEAAKIKCRKYEGSMADLRVGYRALVRGEINGNEVTAKVVEFIPTVYKGAVTAVNGNLITVKTVRQLTVPCVVTEKTQILVRPRVGPNKDGSLSDIRVGMPVNIAGHLMPGAPMQLIYIDVLTGT